MIALGKPAARTSPWICRACRKSQQSLAKRGHATYRKPSQLLPNRPARTRFAPSPTGNLHLGSLRTALFNYLLAKATGGQFLLRIEDTDQKRTIPGAEEGIFRDLEWTGLQWDEGPKVGGPYGPYRQSERTELYNQHAQILLEQGQAYRCFCTSERLNELAQLRSTLGLPTDYDRTCLGIPKEESDDWASKGESHTIRLKVPDQYPQYDDLVYGRVGNRKGQGKKLTHGQQSFEDPILLKSDGLPTYHLANVVDDHLMEITHVVRAVEWMPSTPKHLAMYEAFNWTPPAFAHVGLLQDQAGQKLSKRKMDIDISSFRKSGIFPEALVNHVALLGWSHTLGNDFIELAGLIENFDLKFTKGNTIVNFQKLGYLQKLYAQKYVAEGGERFEEMVDQVMEVIDLEVALEASSKESLREYVSRILKADAKGYSSPQDFFKRIRGFFELTAERWSGHVPVPGEDVLAGVVGELGAVTVKQWKEGKIKAACDAFLDKLLQDESVKATLEDDTEKGVRTKLNHYLRWAVMGSLPGPPMALTMEILGRDITLKRLTEARTPERKMDEEASTEVEDEELSAEEEVQGTSAEAEHAKPSRELRAIKW